MESQTDIFGWQPFSSIPIRTQCYIISVLDYIFCDIFVITHITIIATNNSGDTSPIPFLFISTSLINLFLATLLFIGVKRSHLRKCHIYMFGSMITLIIDVIVWILYVTLTFHVNNKIIFFTLTFLHIISFIYKVYSFLVVKSQIVNIIREKRSQNNSSFTKRGSTEVDERDLGLLVANNHHNQYHNGNDRSPALASNRSDNAVANIRTGGGRTLNVGRESESFERAWEIDDLLHQVEFPPDTQVSSDQFQLGEKLLKRETDFYVKDGRLEVKDGNFTPVAIKIFRQNAEVEAVRRMLLETKILTLFRNHQNIIQILGFCTENIHKGKLILLTGLCAKGNLDDFLKDNYENFQDMICEDEFRLPNADSTVSTRSDENIYQNIVASQPGQSEFNFNSKTLLSWAFQLANGMEFIFDKGIIHGNLSAKHCVVDDRNRVKIANFTFATQLYQYRDTNKPINFTKIELPWRWMAIECMLTDPPNEESFTEKSDIWSYAVTLWEIFTLGCIPYDGKATSEFFPILMAGERLEKPPFATTEIYQIQQKCWQRPPEDRPSFSTLKNDFAEVLHNLMAQN